MLKKSSTYISLLIVASVSVFLIWSALASTVYTFSGEVDDVSTASHTVDLNAGDEVLAWAGCAETTPGSGDRPLDPDLTVFDPTDTEIAYNDDGNDPTCNNYSSSCVIFTAATTGTYRFDIGDVLGSGPFPAPYELRVEVNNPAAVCGAYDFEAPIDEEPVEMGVATLDFEEG